LPALGTGVTSVQTAGICDQTWLFQDGDRAGPQGDPSDRDGCKWEADQTTVLTPRRPRGTPRLSTNQTARRRDPRPLPRTVVIFVLVVMQAMWVPTLGHVNVLSGVHQHRFGERMAPARSGSIDQSWSSTTRKIGGAKATLLRIRNFGMPRHLIPRWIINIAMLMNHGRNHHDRRR
jgi:hypothetical protein